MTWESVADPESQATGMVEFEIEDISPPWRLLVPLWCLHKAHNQFQCPLEVQVYPVGQKKLQPAWFHALVVLNYSYYMVLGLYWPRR